MTRVGDADRLVEGFEERRSQLRAVAYRILGSVTEADDAVQEAWLRLSRSDATEIQNLSAIIAPSQRMIELQSQYYALGVPAAPATAEHLNASRKLMRQLEAPSAKSGVRY